MKIKLILIICIFGLLFPGLLHPQQEVVMSIREGVPVIPIALPKFIVRGSSPQATSTAEALHQVLSNNLKYSRVFNPLPESYYSYIRPLNPDNIFFKDWESIQANLLFVGEITDNDNDGITFEGKLYDVKAGKFIFGKRYQAEKNFLRLSVHKMSDEIMRILGNTAIFSSKIVFISNRDGNDEIYMMDYDGHNQTRITFNKIKDYMPAWSADGKHISYTSYRKGGAGLYILNPFEGKITEVSNAGTNFSPSFSPDGKKMAFCSTLEEGNSEIYIAEADGTKIKRLTFNKAIDTAPTWAPTSRELAFTSDRSGTPQIYIMDAEGSNVRRVSYGGSYFDGPAWSPAGDMIAYVSRVDQVFDIYILNLRTNRTYKITESNARNESPSWSPDGRHLVFSSNRTGSIQLYSIDYDGANMRRLTSNAENKLPDWSRN
ncbi:MAG: Tol-Pal system beta propeller repeat protein TolB [Candidatus Aminicenantes bacterium]|nr:Tol-Pal system beta propeller repeat protein TolB [Candidatus Aminicenantes bacterium]